MLTITFWYCGDSSNAVQIVSIFSRLSSSSSSLIARVQVINSAGLKYGGLDEVR
jgi:hypothetical protein